MYSVAAVKCEGWAVLKQALPNMLQMYVTQFVKRLALALVGHYDPSSTSIAAAALGSMYSNITGLSVGMGITLSLSSFCAHNMGRGAAKENGIVVWQCARVLAVCYIFSGCMSCFSPFLLDHLGQPEELLYPVQDFTMIMLVGLPADWMSFCISFALASQDLQFYTTISQVLCSLINFSCAWAFLANGVGFLGVAWASVIGSWSGITFLIAYVVVAGKQDTVWRIPKEVSKEGRISFTEYLRVALPSAFSVWAEWWAAEVLALFAGLLPGGKDSVAANGILFNTLAIFYMTFVGVSRAAAMRVGFHMGAKDTSGMQLAIALCVSLSVVLSGVVSIVLLVYGPAILGFYTNIPDVLSEGMGANLGMVLSVPPYAVMMTLAGVLRSARQQARAAIALFIAFYLVGIPAGYYLGLIAGMGLLGIWMGNVISLSMSAVLMTMILFTIDWQKLVEAAGNEKGNLESPLLDAMQSPWSRQVSCDSALDAGTPWLLPTAA